MKRFFVKKSKKNNRNIMIGNVSYVAPPRGRTASFHRSMKLTVIIGQCFGLLPVLGVCESDSSKLRFNFHSARCCYTVISIVGQTTLALFCLLHFFKEPSTSVGTKTALIFLVSNVTTTILFLRIATKWPQLCHHISLTEVDDPKLNTTLVTKCKFYCVTILFLASVEHALCDLRSLVAIYDCHPTDNYYEIYLVESFPWIFQIINFNAITGTVALFFNLQCTFNWNYADIFVICISLYLTSRLDHVNKKVMDAKGKYVPSSVWRNIREDYNMVTNLVRRVDDVIGCVTFISFANNVFFICLQMLHTLAPFSGYEHAIYFMFSLILLVGRWLAVSLVTADVHTASRRPVYSLYEVPSAVYCTEVQRFIDQIHSDSIALSGLQFFKVKRGLVLTIAGTIATYELVLLQFAGVTPTAAPKLAVQTS